MYNLIGSCIKPLIGCWSGDQQRRRGAQDQQRRRKIVHGCWSGKQQRKSKARLRRAAY